MANRCQYARNDTFSRGREFVGCDAFARKLTGAEIRNLGGFNLSHEVCAEIFKWTVKGLCPYHAAQALTEDVRPDGVILDILKRKWNYYTQDNFSDASGYALCSTCATSLAADRLKHSVSLIEETLAALSVPQQRIETIVWLQNGASAGLGTCFDCSLVSCIDCSYGPDGTFIETELDRLALADLR